MTIFSAPRDPKLEAVLARLCQELGDLWTTQASKLPYLVDLVAVHVLGQQITSSYHKAWTYGVVTARAWGLVKKARGGKYFEVYGDPIAEGVRLRLRAEPPEKLDPVEEAIVDFVAAEFGSLGTTELGDLTKELNPEVGRWGSRDVVELIEPAYKRLPIWFGEDEADAEFLRQRLQEIRDNPSRMVSAEGFLEALAR